MNNPTSEDPRQESATLVPGGDAANDAANAAPVSESPGPHDAEHPNASPSDASAQAPEATTPEATPPEVTKAQTAMPEAPTHDTAPESPGDAELPTQPVAEAGQAGVKPPPAIQIGSRRQGSQPTTSRPTLGKSAEEIAQQEQPAAPLEAPRKSSPPKPSVRQPLTADLEAEFQDALAGTTMDALMASQQAAAPPAEGLEPKSRRQAQVVRVHGDSVFFSLGGAYEGVAPLAQFPEPPEVGASLEVVVHGQSGEDGLYEVAVPGAAVAVDDWADITEGMVVEARITGSNVGGLECKVNQIRGFIPASQIALYRVENLNEFLEQKLLCVVTEINKRRKNLVLSRRSLLERQQEAERKERLQAIEVGQILEGVVRSLQKFGAFVDLGGLDGLIHISQLSWDRVNHPSEVLSEGDQVRVRVEKVDPQTGKIGLSLRSLTEHPWHNVEEKFPPSIVVEGVVTRLTKFGAFVRLAAGVEGLVHISELAHQRVAQVSNIVREGETLQVKILSVDPEAQRIALSRKAVIEPPPAPEVQEKPEEPAAAARAAAVKKRSNQTLKGGVDRPSGGDQFGLKW